MNNPVKKKDIMDNLLTLMDTVLYIIRFYKYPAMSNGAHFKK